MLLEPKTVVMGVILDGMPVILSQVNPRAIAFTAAVGAVVDR